MTAPGVMDVTAKMIGWLPKTLALENPAHTVTVKWVDELEEDLADRTGVVYGTIRRMSPEVDLLDHRHSKEAVENNVQVDTITFVDGTDDYFVTQRDIMEVVSLEGTMGGVDHTFVEDTDFEVVEGPGYTLLTTIRWLPGGDKPDDDTDFVVDYRHRTVERRGSVRTNVTYRLCLHVDLDPVVSSTRYAKTRLGEMCLESLIAQLVKNQGQLAASGLKIRNIVPLGLISVSPAEDRARFFLDLRVSRHLVYVDEVTQLVGKVTPTTDFLP